MIAGRFTTISARFLHTVPAVDYIGESQSRRRPGHRAGQEIRRVSVANSSEPSLRPLACFFSARRTLLAWARRRPPSRCPGVPVCCVEPWWLARPAIRVDGQEHPQDTGAQPVESSTGSDPGAPPVASRSVLAQRVLPGDQTPSAGPNGSGCSRWAGELLRVLGASSYLDG